MSTPAATDVRAAFKRGMAAALDPETEAAFEQQGRTLTTSRSWWLHTICADPACQHTFRSGDEVLVGADRSVRHCSVLLPCAGALAGAATQSDELTAFYTGLNQAWPPPQDMVVLRLDPSHFLVAPPGKFRRRICFVCGHTLRPHDQVILCPCSPQAPVCQVAIHRDPLHGLHCWEAWNPGKNTQHCPATSEQR